MSSHQCLIFMMSVEHFWFFLLVNTDINDTSLSGPPTAQQQAALCVRSSAEPPLKKRLLFNTSERRLDRTQSIFCFCLFHRRKKTNHTLFRPSPALSGHTATRQQLWFSPQIFAVFGLVNQQEIVQKWPLRGWTGGCGHPWRADVCDCKNCDWSESEAAKKSLLKLYRSI